MMSSVDAPTLLTGRVVTPTGVVDDGAVLVDARDAGRGAQLGQRTGRGLERDAGDQPVITMEHADPARAAGAESRRLLARDVGDEAIRERAPRRDALAERCGRGRLIEAHDPAAGRAARGRGDTRAGSVREHAHTVPGGLDPRRLGGGSG